MPERQRAVWIVRRKACCVSKFCVGFLLLSLFAQHHAEVEVRLAVIGIEPQRRAIRRDCLIQLSLHV